MKKVCCRRLPRCVTWCGSPGMTTPAILAMAAWYSRRRPMAKPIKYGVPGIPPEFPGGAPDAGGSVERVAGPVSAWRAGDGRMPATESVGKWLRAFLQWPLLAEAPSCGHPAYHVSPLDAGRCVAGAERLGSAYLLADPCSGPRRVKHGAARPRPPPVEDDAKGGRPAVVGVR